MWLWGRCACPLRFSGCGVSHLRGIQNLAGREPGRAVLVGPGDLQRFLPTLGCLLRPLLSAQSAPYSLFLCPGQHGGIQRVWKGCQQPGFELGTLLLEKFLEVLGSIAENQ